MSDAESYTAPWDPNKLFAPRVHALLRTMRQCVDEILGSHTLAVVSELVEEGNYNDLKEWSRHGFAYRKDVLAMKVITCTPCSSTGCFDSQRIPSEVVQTL